MRTRVTTKEAIANLLAAEVLSHSPAHLEHKLEIAAIQMMRCHWWLAWVGAPAIEATSPRGEARTTSLLRSQVRIGDALSGEIVRGRQHLNDSC